MTMSNENVMLNITQLWWKEKIELRFKLTEAEKTIDALTNEKEEMRRIMTNMTNMNKDELTKTIESYLETVSTEQDEWYMPIVDIHAKVLKEFMQWAFRVEIEKEARRKQWEILNQEFGAKKKKMKDV